MSRITLALALCVAGLVAGCGSSSTPTIPPGSGAGSTNGSTSGSGALAHTGAVGSVGPPSSGKYSAKNPTVLQHVDSELVKFFTGKGFSGVTANCTGATAATASCKVTGTNSAGKTSAAVLTIGVNQTTGKLKVVHVAS